MSGIALFLFPVLGRAELCADFEQVVLNLIEERVEIGVRHRHPRPTDGAVQLVDLAVRLDAERGFGHPGAPKEAGFTGVAGLRVDLHASVPPLENSVADCDPTPARKRTCVDPLPAALLKLLNLEVPSAQATRMASGSSAIT